MVNDECNKEKSYLCPISCATVKAEESPVSSLTIQLLSSVHIPSIGAKPTIKCSQIRALIYCYNQSIVNNTEYVIQNGNPVSNHAIIFSDKSGTMDFILRDLRAFSGTDPQTPPPPPPPDFFYFFFFSIIGQSLYSAMPKPDGAE